MVGFDIIFVTLIILVILSLVFLSLKNGKRIKDNEAKVKLEEIKQATAVEQPKKEEKLEENPKIDTLYGFELKEVNAKEIAEHPLAVGEIKKFNLEVENLDSDEYDESLVHESAGSLIKNIEFELETEFDKDQDYEIGIDDEDDVEFTNALSEEFKNLSPSMKAFIITNILKPKHDIEEHFDELDIYNNFRNNNDEE